MAAKFNPVPFAALEAFFVEKGFEQSKVRKEVVFQRTNHHNPELILRVFTSCGLNGEAVRRKGTDAIRISLIWEPHDGSKAVGVLSAKRVNRCGTTEAILDRIYTRMREVYREANRIAKTAPCACGAPRYADSGKCIRRKACQKKAA